MKLRDRYVTEITYHTIFALKYTYKYMIILSTNNSQTEIRTVCK